MRNKKNEHKRIRDYALLSAVIALLIVGVGSALIPLYGCSNIVAFTPKMTARHSRASFSPFLQASSVQKGTMTTETQVQDELAPVGDLNVPQLEQGNDADATESTVEKTKKTLAATIKKDEETRYTIKATYDSDAGIPDNATLQVRELKSTTERVEELGRLLEVKEDDHVLQNVFINVAIASDGAEVNPATPIELQIISSIIKPGESDAVEAAVLGYADAPTITVINRTGIKDNGEEDPKPSKTSLRLLTDKLGDIGLSVVATSKYELDLNGVTLSVLGGRNTNLDCREYEFDESLGNEKTLVRTLVAIPDPAHEWPTTLWLTKRDNRAAEEQRGEAMIHLVREGEIAQELVGPTAGDGPVAISSSDELAFVWQESVQSNEDELEEEPTEPTQDEETTSDNDETSQPGEAGTENQTESSDTQQTEQPQAEEKQKSGDADSADQGTGVDKQTTEKKTAPIVREHRIEASDGRTYRVTASYDSTAGIPRDAQLQVREVVKSDVDYVSYVAKGTQALGVGLPDVQLVKVLDISFFDPISGETYQPFKGVQVSIELLDADVADDGELSVAHISDDGTAQPMDTTSDGLTVDFDTTGFSVFVIVFNTTLNSESYSYVMGAGESTELSTLLTNLGIDDQVQIADITNVTSNPVDESITAEKTQNDWTIATTNEFTSGTLMLYRGEGDSDPITINISVKPSLTITAGSGDKEYDGTPLTEDSITSDGLEEGDRIESVKVTGAQTDVGTASNVPSEAKVVNEVGDDVTESYAITYVNGTLTVNRREITITADSETKVYDGYALTNTGYKANPEELADGDEIESVKVTGSQTDVGESASIPSGAKIVRSNDEGTDEPIDVTNNYLINYVSGTLTVTVKPITITADSAEKQYDGTALTKNSYTSTGLADGDVFDSVTVTGTQTNVGDSANIPSEAKIVHVGDDGVRPANDNYKIEYINGTLKVTKQTLTITAGSDTKAYDGTALTNETYTTKNLAEGNRIQSISVVGSQTNAGTSKNVASEAVIVDSDENNVTGFYEINYEDGALEVTQKRVKLTAVSSVKAYTGSQQTVEGFTVSADGKTLNGVTFNGVTASGSGTEEGSYDVTLSGVTVNETSDTTGNYVVTETEKGTLLITAQPPIEKKMSFYGNKASYTINVNPNGLELNGGNALTLEDTYTSNQTIDYSTVTSNNSSVSYDYNGQKGTFTIPDKTPVTITYTTRVSGAAGTSATFGNTAELGVIQNGSFAAWYAVTVSRTETITPTDTDIEGAGDENYIRLYTYAHDYMEVGLGGAEFRLLDSNQRPITYQAGEQAGETVTYETGADGYVNVELDDGLVSIRKNTNYYLEMVTAPVVHEGDSYTYYKKDSNLYPFLITDNPSYVGDNGYFNGDVLKVCCYPETNGVTVTKRFSGNYTPTEDQKNKLLFVLQKEDLAIDAWVDVESHTYAEFSNGSMNFSTGRDDGSELEPAVLYRVVEKEDAAIEGIDYSQSVSLTYQRNNRTVEENTNEFERDPDDPSSSFNLVFDNAYIDHKLTIEKVNELTGERLSGAEFTVYKAQDNTKVTTYTTDENGLLTIRRNYIGLILPTKYEANTTYYVVETKAPSGYLEAKNPEKIYFYFSENDTAVPEGVPAGKTAVDLTTSYDSITLANQSETTNVPVAITWFVDESEEWPAAVGDVEVGLYQSVNGGDAEPVLHDGKQLTTILNSGKTYDNTTFVNLPARDADDNDITYSVVQKTNLPDYYTSYKVSGTGWYVIKNETAASVTIKKEWYDLAGDPVPDVSDKQAVQFDLYRTTTDNANISSRSELEEFLRGATPVKTGLELSKNNGWENTVTSLQEKSKDGQDYYYFALEREDTMPQNTEDSYDIVPAAGGNMRELTIKNKQTLVTIIIKAADLEKDYGQNDPAFTFTTEVQDDHTTLGEPVLGEDGKYTITATKDGETKNIVFECNREEEENTGSYAIELSGKAEQEGYRIRFDDGNLTIKPAQVTVKGTATKVYGDPDPSLVEITGLKEGDSIQYYAYRDIGESKGSYRITVTGLAKQGNYEITYVNDYLTIAPAPVTVTADNIEKAFGQDDPTLTVTMTGLKNQDAKSVIKYEISRETGESVGQYPITVTGASSQGNYTVTYEPGTFTIKGTKVTVRAKNLMKTYGDPDPEWQAEVTGLEDGDSIEYRFSRVEGEDVGTYVITPVGETAQGNYEVTYETGLLTIYRAPLTVTPDNLIKALTDPITDDPQLTASFDRLVNNDDQITPVVVHEGNEWIYTYTREGKTQPEFGFALTRTAGENAGSYVIAATARGEQPRNYSITYKTGVFTILATHNVVVNQQTRDLVDYAQNPEYSYTAVLDLSSIGIEDYSAEGFENNRMSFTLPADGHTSKTLQVPASAKLTITQETENPDYTTDITLDANPVAGTSVEIDSVNRGASIVVTHERISLPVEARAAQRQTADGKADEDGATAVTPLAYLGIARDAEHNPVAQNAEGEGGFIRELDAQGVYNLPEDKYYVPEHASVYNGENLVAQNVQAIRYDATNKVWQYRLASSEFTSFSEGDQLVLFYMPKYICRVEADDQQYYTLNDALKHIDEITPDQTDDEGNITKLGNGVIEMLIDSYNMPASDAVTIPKNFNITLTTANELNGPANILRKPSFTTDHMLSNNGTLTLGKIILDGNKTRVTASGAMVLNNGALTVNGDAILQNASSNNGGALYANNGSVTVIEGATFTGNKATNGGAIYFRGGSFSLATSNVTNNSATNGGAIFIADANEAHTLTLTGTLGSNTATNGGAVYMEGGKLEVSGGISGNTATNGGAVFVNKGTLNLTAGTVGNNTATDGGAVYLTGGTLNVSGGAVSGNSAEENGGAIYTGNATISITGGSVTGNTATNGSGGAVYLTSGTAAIGGGSVQGNNAANGNGGVVCQTGGTLTVTGTINGANTAKNGSAVFVQNGRATFDGCNITGNTATAGGAIGVGSTEARLFFANDAKVTGNTWNSGRGNLYLDQDTDLVINTAGLGGNANIGVRVADEYRSTRGDAACKFGTYTGTNNLSRFKNDVNTELEACDNNYKIIWSKPITVQVLRLNSYVSAFPPAATATSLKTFTYSPKAKENDIYDLVMEMYNAVYKASITGDDLYAYSFATTASDFSQFLTSINWDSDNQRWNFVEHTGNVATGTPDLKIYYSQGAYISIVNNSSDDLTVNPMTVLGANVPFYGYPTVKNNITLNTLEPVTTEDLTLKSGENVKLLFPGAVNQNWTMTGTFTNPTTHEPVANSIYAYTLDRTHGGQKQSGTTDASGSFSLNGKTNNKPGGSYEILFGDPTNICKVTDGAGEHPFPTLNAAWNYIVDNDLTYTMEDETTMPGGTIEMLVDYLQPASDVLNINESSFTGKGKTYGGYCLKLTTAATSGVKYPYIGAEGVTRATISRDSDNDGAAVIAMPYKKTKAETAEQCNAFLIVDNLTFDGKALAKKGNGGAISTANNVVTITRCDFKGYQAVRGGAVFVAWGGLTVGGDNPAERCTFSNCSTGDSTGDKIGGGGIWTSAQNLIVKNADFENCACIQGNSQGGGIFHNIRKDNESIYTTGDYKDYAKFPTGYSLSSTTWIEGCTFKNCYSVDGSGGTIESDSMVVTIKGCSFDGSYSNKNNANGGAVNILHNDAFGSSDVYPNASLTVIDTTFKNCQTNTGNSYGGAICDQNSVTTEIVNCNFINCSSNRGGAIVTNRAGKVPTDLQPGVIDNGITVSILGSRFKNCTARAEGGAVHTTTTGLTISDTYKDDNGQNVTAETWFKDCSAPSYGGVYQVGNVAGSSVTVNNASFENCKSDTGNAGALMVNARSLSITGTARENDDDPYTFNDCSAGKAGGAVYHSPSNPVNATLTNVSFNNCKADAEGGGARLVNTAINITGAEVRNCEAVTNGGGIYVQGATTLEDCVFSGNKATGTNGNGGSLYINSGTVGINGGSISDSLAVLGGGVYNKGTLTISKGSAENGGTISNCVAKTSGGGIYTTNKLTLSGVEVSECYAVTSGGGIYQSGNSLYPYGVITGCYAKQGGGIYSNGYLEINEDMLLSDCHAATVTIAEDDAISVEAEHSDENLGGGIYKGGSTNWDFKSENATISNCSAYDGGGVYYNSTGKLTYSNGNFYGNTATNNGGAIYKNLGTVNMSGGVIGGSDEQANRAQLGAGIFVADGQTITIGGGRITHNVAEVGGAVAVGGNNTNTQLLFQGSPFINYNTLASGEKCNVYLNYDTNRIIRTSSTGLAAGAYIGVYVNDEQFIKHGDYSMPFGTYSNAANLSSFFNDRIYAGGKQGSSSNQIVWGEFVCKITDSDGNLLYTDATCKAPAVYATLENGEAANTTSAFGMVSYANPNLYNASGKYSGAYQIQMLVGDYDCTKQIKLNTGAGSKDITLTTASRTPDECGFYYTGTADQAVIRRGSNYASMIDTTKMSRLVIENITIDAGSQNGFKSTSVGGIMNLTGGTQVYLNQNAVLCNSNANGFNGAGIRMDGSEKNHLYINGAEIRNCVNANYGGGISAKKGSVTMNNGLITGCSATHGGGLIVEQNMYLKGGTISGNNASSYGGGIDLKGKIYFTGNPIVSGNTLKGDTPCNLQLMNDNNVSIIADDIGPFAEIRVYTDSAEGKNDHVIYINRGGDGDPFGTWESSSNLHCFINDRDSNLRGMKTANDKVIYWRTNPILTVGKVMASDWSVDKDEEFTFTVTLEGQDDFSGTYEDMTFVDGMATIKLKAGQVRTASSLPPEMIHDGVHYTVTESLTEGQSSSYTTQYTHNDDDPVDGMSVTGRFGENMSEDPTSSSSVSKVEFTNTRITDDLTISKTVTKGLPADEATPFTFKVTLDDNTITKTYTARRYQSPSDVVGVPEQPEFNKGVASFKLMHGQSYKIMGLPKGLGFKVEENLTDDQYADFRTYVTADDGGAILSYSSTGNVGERKHIAFNNERYGIVCKIVNDTSGREQLYYRDGNNPEADQMPAIYDELEKAFEAINQGINFFTADGATADVKLRIEMVKPNYEMNRTASLNSTHYVTLGTALKTDYPYQYPTDAESPAVVTRGFGDGSMFVDSGNLTIDNIILDGSKDTFTPTSSNGGIVHVDDGRTLTVTNNATLCNSGTSGNGGAIWIGERANLSMSGTITNCEANAGGGVYAVDGFGSVATVSGLKIDGTIAKCKATTDGGAIYAGTASDDLSGQTTAPIVLTNAALLTSNISDNRGGDMSSNRGGAMYAAADIEIDGTDVSITGNIAETGGGIYLDPTASLTMNGGAVSNNTATKGNGGGIYVPGKATITNGVFNGNEAADGDGGAIFAATGSEVSIQGEDTSFTKNTAKQGGAIYDKGTVTFAAGSMTNNTATGSGGAVYVAEGHTFSMSGGVINENKSPEGAVSTGANAVLNFSGSAEVYGNKANDDTTAMNVFLGYDSNTIINAANLTDVAQIGVYVTNDNEDIYHNHGIANRPFGTGSGENLNAFVNDRDSSLTGMQGAEGKIIWPGKDCKIQVYQYGTTTPVGGAKFSLVNTNGETVWSGESNASTGLLTIPWGVSDGENKASFVKFDEDGNVAAVTYTLSQEEANKDTVRPAGTWELTIGVDNSVTWVTRKATDDKGEELKEVNRILNVEPSDGTLYLGDVFNLYNDVKPHITFDPDGGRLSGKEDSSTRSYTVDFGPKDWKLAYKIEEANPTKDGSVFQVWEDEDKKEYNHGDEILFFRDSDNDDMTLKAKWKNVVCKITDRDDHLLYVDGSPAVYWSLKAGFKDFNNKEFTLNGVKATPRKIKMLVGEYEMSELVTLDHGKTAELTTASSKDTDGYSGPKQNCTIKRAPDFNSGSMIVNNYNLVIRNITLDGSTQEPFEGDGGIVTVKGKASHLTLAQDAKLCNAKVTGKGGAVYAEPNTIVTVASNSEITGCTASNGGAIYGDQVTLSGGKISGNVAKNDTDEDGEARGGGIYATGSVNMTGGQVTRNKGQGKAYGGGLYLSENAELTMTGGSISGNGAVDGGGVYTNGDVILQSDDAIINGNTATQNGGGVFVSTDGRLTLRQGSVGKNGSPNVAAKGSGVYLAGTVQLTELTGGSISYNGQTGTGNGGGLYVNNGESGVTLKGTTLSNNLASNGGGAYVAAGCSLTIVDGTVSKNEVSDNGAGVYVDAVVDEDGTETPGTFNLESGTISGNKASGNGGAVYLKDHAQMNASGGTISGNDADGPNGGAINVGGLNSRINLSGAPTIFNNPGNAATTSQKNLVLSVDSNSIINTSGDGLTGGHIGIYVISGANYYNMHGIYNKPFGTFGGTEDENRENAKYLVNDRDLALSGVHKDDNTIYWPDVVCKVTDAGGKLLYKYATVSGTDIKVYASAVYGTLEEGMDAVNESLYRKSNSRYAVYNRGDLQVEMLKDVELINSESSILYDAARNMTLTTAKKKGSADDPYIFEGEGEKATLTRGQSNNAMFTVDTPNNSFDVSKLIIDGGNSAMLTRQGVNGGAFDIKAVSYSSFDDVTLKNLNATDKGGAIYLAGGSLELTKYDITGCIANEGGAIYVDKGGSITLANGTINGNGATEGGNGAGIYLAEGSTLTLFGGDDTPKFGGTGVDENDNLVMQDANGVATGNFVVRGEYTETTQNGGKEYPRGEDNKYYARQDIYIAGYGEEDAPSLRVAGNLNGENGEGTIWVWAEEAAHCVTGKQFAKNGKRGSSPSVGAFRNAQDDVTTQNNTGGYLTAEFVEGNMSNIFWTGIKGGRKVILRKLDKEYKPMSEKKFTIYKGASTSPYQAGEKTLEDLSSNTNGVFYIGGLPYGWYIIEENDPNRFFYVVVTPSGTYGTLVQTGEEWTDQKGGYENRLDAEDAAQALYDAKNQ